MEYPTPIIESFLTWLQNNAGLTLATEDQLLQLTDLSISFKKIIQIPREIGRLTRLQKLAFDCNKLTCLPSEIGQLTNLTELELGSNKLGQLPPEIGQLTKLTHLFLDFNDLTQLPTEIGLLRLLKCVHFDYNRLSCLPPQICQLTNLTLLVLSRNNLTSLPAEIGLLTQLTELRVDMNQLTQLPPEIGQLSDLKCLWLDFNKLTCLPVEIGQLSQLALLSANGNELAQLPPLNGLTQLGQLLLNDNLLTRLSADVEQHPGLFVLSFRNNFLHDHLRQKTKLPSPFPKLPYQQNDQFVASFNRFVISCNDRYFTKIDLGHLKQWSWIEKIHALHKEDTGQPIPAEIDRVTTKAAQLLTNYISGEESDLTLLDQNDWSSLAQSLPFIALSSDDPNFRHYQLLLDIAQTRSTSPSSFVVD